MSRQLAGLAAWKLNAVLVVALATVAMPRIANAGIVITPLSATASSFQDAGHSPTNLINGSGLDVNTPSGLHDNHPGAATMWTAGTGGLAADVDNTWVEFDLGGVYDLMNARIWQYNQNSLPGRQLRQFDILVSPNLVDPFTLVASNVELSQFATTPGPFDAPATPGIPAQLFAAGSLGVQRVRFELDTAWSGSPGEFVGLSEVKFEVVPEPTAGAVLLIGSGLLAMRRRHRG